jgi:hypothetical protein
MLIYKSITTTSGLTTTIHRIQQFGYDSVGNISMFTESWATEAAYLSGANPDITNAVKFKASDIFSTAVFEELSRSSTLAGGMNISNLGSNLEDLRKKKLLSLTESRERTISGGFTYAGKMYDSDAVAQSRILGAKVSGNPKGLRTADNSWVLLSPENLNELWSALEQHVSDAFIKFAGLEVALNAATTEDAIAAVNWA